MATTTTSAPPPARHLVTDPVPPGERTLGAREFAVLWGDLAVGVLVLVAGALLVAPAEAFGLALNLTSALTVTVVGSVIGVVLLAWVGRIGAGDGVPTMVLLRPVLGVRGSWLASTLNVAQLVGWAAFELWVMALMTSRISERLVGVRAYPLWLVAFSVLCIGFALWGPRSVVRVWLERFGIWVVLAAGAVLTLYVVLHADAGRLLRDGVEARAFGPGLDLVIAMPISWLPLVADYSRFGRAPRAAFTGTFWGYLLGNVWFYGLGALLILGTDVDATSPAGIAAGILAVSGAAVTGVLFLAALLAGETDGAFANVYSAAVSIGNVRPRWSQARLVVGVGVVATVLAAFIGTENYGNYELFLFLVGSVFVPLFGVLLADRVLLARSYTADAPAGVRVGGLAAWAVGFVLYHWIAPTPLSWWSCLVDAVLPGAPLAGKVGWLGASLPSLLAAAAVYFVIERVRPASSVPPEGR